MNPLSPANPANPASPLSPNQIAANADAERQQNSTDNKTNTKSHEAQEYGDIDNANAALLAPSTVLSVILAAMLLTALWVMIEHLFCYDYYKKHN